MTLIFYEARAGRNEPLSVILLQKSVLVEEEEEEDEDEDDSLRLVLSDRLPFTRFRLLSACSHKTGGEDGEGGGWRRHLDGYKRKG
ncbi:hypothetical protein C0Q70_09608 [Pomacea canaliculata]|uniref:Uncharacterized protein n=1 Tax=Pomacea canaliculata TaxID=400727 RepID=A0A2T7PA96_POMCA|nr:hypothetical protein C0Q70_09608 [Pomacea canaliculata]